MKKGVTLGAVLTHLAKVGEDLENEHALVDLKGVFPHHDHHQTAVFLRMPYPEAFYHGKVNDRITKLLASLNRPDTIKADVYTVLGHNIVQGYQPHIDWPVKDGKKQIGGLYDFDRVIAMGHNYCLQITVDVVLPDVMAKALGMTDAEAEKAMLEKAVQMQKVKEALYSASQEKLDKLWADLLDSEMGDE